MKSAIPTDDELLRQITAAEHTIKVCQRNIKIAKDDLLDRRDKEIKALLSQKPDPFGVVKITVGNHQVSIDTPKKVDWDEKKLDAKRLEILESGDNPDMYIKTKLSVTETAYKAFPDDVKEFFNDARTVKSGSVTIKVIEEKE